MDLENYAMKQWEVRTVTFSSYVNTDFEHCKISGYGNILYNCKIRIYILFNTSHLSIVFCIGIEEIDQCIKTVNDLLMVSAD